MAGASLGFDVPMDDALDAKDEAGLDRRVFGVWQPIGDSFVILACEVNNRAAYRLPDSLTC
jgi:hypothetical protein